MPTHRRSGFTARELLLVSCGTVISVLLFAKWIEAANHSRKNQQCQSQLKSYALSIRAYTADYDGCFPTTHGNGITGDMAYGWAGAVQAYYGGINVLQCPLEPRHPTATTTTATPDYIDYWFNARLPHLVLTRLKYPARTFVLGDGATHDATYVLSDTVGPWSPTAPYALRHQGGANYAFVDGHVKWLRPAELSPATPAHPGVFTFRT